MVMSTEINKTAWAKDLGTTNSPKLL